MSAPVLEVRNVGYAVGGVPLLADVSVDVAPGTLHAILGPNGAGKSTLMRICVGELPASTGEVRLNERALTQIDPADQARMRSYAGSVEHIPFPYTVSEICRLGTQKISGQAFTEVLTLLDVERYADRIISTLSNGERERVFTARALLQIWEEPDRRVALLDEPTANLDPAHQQVTMRALQSAASRGIAVVIVLHDLSLALRFADAATLLKNGSVQASGPTGTTLTSDALSALFDVPIGLFAVESLRRPVVAVVD